MKPPRDPERHIPDHRDHQYRLDDPQHARLHDLLKQQRGAHNHQAGFDVKLAAGGFFQPVWH